MTNKQKRRKLLRAHYKEMERQSRQRAGLVARRLLGSPEPRRDKYEWETMEDAESRWKMGYAIFPAIRYHPAKWVEGVSMPINRRKAARKRARERKKARVLARKEKAQKIANRLLGENRYWNFEPPARKFTPLNRQGTAIQHIDGNSLNNDPANIRVVTLSQNNR